MNTLDKVYDLTIDIKNIDVKYNSYAKFFDDDRETSIIRIKLLNDKTPMNLENCIVEACFILADNTYHNEACKIINSSEGVVELQLCQKCLVKGENIVRLSISKDNEISNTPVITYEVRKGLYSDNPSFNDDPLTPILSQMLLDIKVTKVNQIELQERYEKTLPKIEGKIEEVDNAIDRVNNAIASGTQDLEVKEARVDKNGKSYSKLGDRLNEVDSQLAQITNNFVHIKDFYEDDFLVALKTAIDKGNKKINIDGEYECNSSLTMNSVHDLELVGNCLVSCNTNAETFLELNSCQNILIDGLVIDFNNHECYITIKLNGCENVELNRISIKNIANTNKDVNTTVIYSFSKNVKMNSIELNNITNLTDVNEIGSKGALTGIFLNINQANNEAYINNIRATNIFNKNYQDNERSFRDCDIIKSQYTTGLTTGYIDSKIVINDVTCTDFGKRIIKLQSGGANISNINGYNNFGDTYAPISLFRENVNIRNIYFKGNCYTGVSMSNGLKNINVDNVLIEGVCTNSVIELHTLSTDTARNISIKNIYYYGEENLSEHSESVIYLGSNIENAIFENINVVNGYFRKGVLRHSSFSINMNNVTIKNCDFDLKNVTKLYSLNIYECEHLNLKIDGCKHKYDVINSTSSLFDIGNLTGKLSKLFIRDCIFIPVGKCYAYGQFQLHNLDKIEIFNTIIDETNSTNISQIIVLDCNTLKINNFECLKGVTMTISNIGNLSDFKCNTLRIIAKEETTPSLILFGYKCTSKKIDETVKIISDLSY